MNTLRVLDSGPLTTIQDLGRFGYGQFGVSISGAMDPFALRAANELVGNAAEAAALEIGAWGATLEATEPCLVAVTGAGYVLSVQGLARPLWSALFVRKGWQIEIAKGGDGSWVYLAVASGIESPLVLGSRSTYARGAFGGHEGRALRAGDCLVASAPARYALEFAGREISPDKRPRYSRSPTVEVILGPQTDRFTAEGARTFLSSEYRISAKSDRMGYRLEGPAVAHTSGADIISDGIAFGSIQVPADGQPIVMMAERPTTGGYPKIAVVASADHPVLAQCSPGVGRVRFRETTVEGAQERWRAAVRQLRVCDEN